MAAVTAFSSRSAQRSCSSVPAGHNRASVHGLLLVPAAWRLTAHNGEQLLSRWRDVPHPSRTQEMLRPSMMHHSLLLVARAVSRAAIRQARKSGLTVSQRGACCAHQLPDLNCQTSTARPQPPDLNRLPQFASRTPAIPAWRSHSCNHFTAIGKVNVFVLFACALSLVPQAAVYTGSRCTGPPPHRS